MIDCAKCWTLKALDLKPSLCARDLDREGHRISFFLVRDGQQLGHVATGPPQTTARSGSAGSFGQQVGQFRMYRCYRSIQKLEIVGICWRDRGVCRSASRCYLPVPICVGFARINLHGTCKVLPVSHQQLGCSRMLEQFR